MAIVNNIDEVLHRIRVQLYHNHLPHVEGLYIARTNNEATLTIEEFCRALKNRSSFFLKEPQVITFGPTLTVLEFAP
ncbi:MAG: hypothetical protein LBF75_05295 [Treponema sp.]|jgi:hypothetical protein|nr:hypothetical protein [Treponema sp.]